MLFSWFVSRQIWFFFLLNKTHDFFPSMSHTVNVTNFKMNPCTSLIHSLSLHEFMLPRTLSIYAALHTWQTCSILCGKMLLPASNELCRNNLTSSVDIISVMCQLPFILSLTRLCARSFSNLFLLPFRWRSKNALIIITAHWNKIALCVPLLKIHDARIWCQKMNNACDS